MAAVDTKMAMTYLGAPSFIVQLGPLTKLGTAYLIDRGNKIAEKSGSCFDYHHLPTETCLFSLNTSFCFKHEENEDLYVKHLILEEKAKQRASDQISKV